MITKYIINGVLALIIIALSAFISFQYFQDKNEILTHKLITERNINNYISYNMAKQFMNNDKLAANVICHTNEGDTCSL